MSSSGRKATVSVRSRPIWWLRLRAEAPRYLLGALSLFGLAASARFAIAPPGVPAAVSSPLAGSTPDLAAESYAVQFARRLLTWNASTPEAAQRALEATGESRLPDGTGLALPDVGQEQVQWAEVAQARKPQPAVHVYTVAAETEPGGLRYLTVTVVRRPDGQLALGGYPAFVGPPASSPEAAPGRLVPVSDGALALVVRRALGNYLSASRVELAADLTSEAVVSVPASPMEIVSAPHDYWSAGGGAVTAVLEARDGLGATYTLAYEVDVVRIDGRWEISAIQTDPDA